MHNNYTNKFFLIALALIIFTFGLEAQNLPPKKSVSTEIGEVTPEVATEMKVFEQQVKDKIEALPVAKAESAFRPFSEFGLLKGRAYDFPVWPGTKAWANHQSPLEATDIPREVLKKMSTDDLLATIMDYPLRFNFIVYNDQPTAFKNLLKISLFQEFFSRQDATVKIIDFYESLDPEAPKSDWGLVKIGDYCTTFSYLEMLLLSPELFDKLTHEQDIILLQQMLSKAAKMDLHPEFYGNMNGVFTTHQAFLAGKILLRENAVNLFKNPETKMFLNGDHDVTTDFNPSIYDATKQFLLTIKN